MNQSETYADELRIVTLTPHASNYKTIGVLVEEAGVTLPQGALIQCNVVPASTATLKDMTNDAVQPLAADEVRMFPARNFKDQFGLISEDTVSCEFYIEKD